MNPRHTAVPFLQLGDPDRPLTSARTRPDRATRGEDDESTGSGLLVGATPEDLAERLKLDIKEVGDLVKRLNIPKQ